MEGNLQLAAKVLVAGVAVGACIYALMKKKGGREEEGQEEEAKEQHQAKKEDKKQKRRIDTVMDSYFTLRVIIKKYFDEKGFEMQMEEENSPNINRPQLLQIYEIFHRVHQEMVFSMKRSNLSSSITKLKTWDLAGYLEQKEQEKKEGKVLLNTAIKLIAEELEVETNLIKQNLGLIIKDKTEENMKVMREMKENQSFLEEQVTQPIKQRREVVTLMSEAFQEMKSIFLKQIIKEYVKEATEDEIHELIQNLAQDIFCNQTGLSFLDLKYYSSKYGLLQDDIVKRRQKEIMDIVAKLRKVEMLKKKNQEDSMDMTISSILPDDLNETYLESFRGNIEKEFPQLLTNETN